MVTVNDYLARRDAEWMGSVHHFLGLSVGLIQVKINIYNYELDVCLSFIYFNIVLAYGCISPLGSRLLPGINWGFQIF